MPAVPDLPAERGPEQQAGPLNPEWRNGCPGRLSASWGHHRPHRRYGSGYPLVLLIVVRLNYMSALYFSSISFAAHKKHGGVWVSPAGRRVTSQIVLAHGRHLSCSCGAADKRRPALRKDLGGNPAPGLRLLWGRRIHLKVLRIQSWEGLNCTFLFWALFPNGALLDRASS